MANIVPKIAQDLYNQQTQVTEPSARALIDPCAVPSKLNDSELTVLFPTTSDSTKKTVPAMGGSIVKISLGTSGDKINQDKYPSYLNGIIDKKVSLFNDEELKKLEKGSTSSLRVHINRLYVESILSDLNIEGVPNLYLSSTLSDFATLDDKSDYYGIIRKNARFGFVPIEAIIKLLKSIATTTESGVEKSSTIGAWCGLSGRQYYSNSSSITGLYQIATSESPSDDDILCLIMDMLPFFNLSEKEMLEEPTKPVLAGYFTIINNNIYLKMPDFSGADSAGYSSDYITESELNFLFQLIIQEKGFYSVKNIEIKTFIPVVSQVEDFPGEYFINGGEDFSITFSSNFKPSKVYLSPAIEKTISLKDNFFSGISASQSGSFIEYNPYPNPFISITNTNLVDQPFNGFTDDDIRKIRYYLASEYNEGMYASGEIYPYISNIGFSSGFPFDQNLLKKSSGVIKQTLSAYEFSGNLSRQNLILHNGSFASDESSGKPGNNSKYFKKNFVANQSGLCENYRPRVFSKPEDFIPSTWIMATSIGESGESFIAKFSITDLKKFYSDSATKMKFVVYAFDGHNQISKFENGYLSIGIDSPEITKISPDGSKVDAKILKCKDSDFAGISKISIETPTAQYVTSVKINDFEIKKNNFLNISGTKIKLDIPCEVEIKQGVAKVVVCQGDICSKPYSIYIANGSDITTEDASIKNASLLPDSVVNGLDLDPTEVSADNLFIDGKRSEIPICYNDPRARIKIKSKKKIFEEGRPIYLYLAFESKEIVEKFSQDYIELNGKWIAKDFSYKLSNSITSDFYRKSKKKAELFFPGNTHSTKPLSLLYTDVSKAYLIISTKDSANFSTAHSLGILQLGDDATDKSPKINAFVEPPMIIGMAARFYDNGIAKNHLNNFGIDQTSEKYKKIANKILDEVGVGQKEISAINVEDKFKKIAILFKYRELKNFKKKFFSLYIKNVKVSKIFSLEGVKKASDLSLNDDSLLALSKNLYYFIISDLNISTSDSAEVRIDISDKDFSIINSTKNKYIDYSIRIDKNNISESTSNDIKSIYINSDQIQISAIDNGIGSLFGTYGSGKALTGFFIDNFNGNILNFVNYPKLTVNSSISGKVSAVKEPGASDVVVNLSKYSESELVSSLPNSYFTVASGSEVYSNQYIKGNSDYLVFLRLQVTDICKIGVLTPEIISINPSGVALVPGSRLILEVNNLQPTFVVEISGIQAKVVGIDGSKVSVIVPEGIPPTISITDCGILIYNGNQILNRGILQLGKQMAETLDRAAAGVLSEVTNQFQEWKEKLALHPIRFVGNVIDKANLAKEFLTSFCNFSFKIVGDLSINLQGFSQLLIPIKVLLCLIDVICNLFNPFQLPSAIIRLFECLYDLILLLPQISVPVMFLNLLIHLLDLLECLVVKVLNLITIINLSIDAIATIVADPANLNFRDLMVLEELLLKYVVSVEADLELLTPVTQVLAIFLQLLQLVFRFPCSINPNSISAPCGIDGFEVGAMVSGMIAEKTGTEPDATYMLKKEYLIPISQPFTKVASEVATPPSYTNATEPERGLLAFDGTQAVDGNLYNLSYFNDTSMRKKESGFDPETGDQDDITSDTYVSLSASYTKRRKTFDSSQSVIFKFNSRTWKSAILPDIVDQQVIDEFKAFDTPVVLLSKSSENLYISGASSYGNFYSLLDGKEMMTTPVDGAASILPLTLDIVQNGVTVQRTFNTIPSMLLLDEEFNVYVVNEGGIIFGEYKDLDGNTVTGITEIRATVINKQSSTSDVFNKEDEVIGTIPPAGPDGEIPADAVPVTKSIFSLPQLYFVDTRVAAESIQAKCETSSVNQIPLDLSGDGGVGEVEKMSGCLGDFISAITSQTNQIKSDLSLGKVPTKMSQDKVSSAYGTLIDCTNGSIDNICTIVINPLNTSFLLQQDTDETPILPDTALPADILSGFQASGPVLTGAREYAAGIGDAATVTVGNLAIVEIIPRDSYDNLIYYDLSQKIRIEIISDTTESAEIKLSPIESNNQNYLVYNETTKSYTASITASNPGEVKIKASICNNPIQALTYGDLVVAEDSGKIDCVPDSNNTATDSGNIPLGALTRINRILTITFVSPELVQTVITDFGMGDNIITQPQLFGTNLEN